MSLAQRLYDFGKRYVWDLQTTKPESKIDDRGRRHEPERQVSQRITMKTLRNVYLQEPMIHKGITKRNRDIIRDGWEVVHRDSEKEVDDKDKKLIELFNKASQIKLKLERSGISSDVYGNGFIEIIYDELEDVTIDMPIADKAKPADLRILNAEYIKKKEKKEGDKTEYFIYNKPGTGKIYMHPQRIVHDVKDKLPYSDFGESMVFNCHKVLQSKMNADEYYGEHIEWAGSGKFDVLARNTDPSQIKEIKKELKVPQRLYIHNEDFEYKIHNPTTMSPKEYNEYFFINIAAAIGMPQHILTGVQPGQLKGSEIGLADYYKDITSIQELVYTPILERLYGQLLKSEGRSFQNYEIRWNPIYVDEASEAEILKLRSEAASNAIDRFAIDEDEYREMLRNGIANLSGESVLEKEKPEKEPAPTQPEMPEEEKLQWKFTCPEIKPLTESQKEHIKKMKEYGKKEAVEQEKRLREAENKLKNQFKRAKEPRRGKNT